MSSSRSTRPVGVDAVVVALVAAVIGIAWNWRPSFWYDEAATIHVSTRDFDDLRRLFITIDAVHGLYYAGMHYWLGLFGTSEFAARLPSALGVAAAAAGVVVLGDRLGSRRLAVVSGLLFAILPRVGWAALEARSYALTTTVAVWLTVLLVASPAARTRLRRVLGWVAYALTLAVSVVLFTYTVTLVPAHLIAVVASRRLRRGWIGWTVATVVALGALTPFLLYVQGQQGQIAWIPELDAQVIRSALVGQWFVGAPGLAVAFAVVVVVAAALSLRRPGDGTWRAVLPVAVPWMLVPTATLVGVSLVADSIYLERYLTFTTPAVALVGGLAVTRLTTRRWTTAIAVVLAAVLALPGQLAQREPDSKPDRMDFSEVNRFAATHLQPGDCVLFGTAAWNPATSQRLVEDVNPKAFDDARDIGLAKNAAVQGMLWDEERPVEDLTAPLSTCSTLWYFTDGERGYDPDDGLPPYRFEATRAFFELTADGFHIDDRWSFTMSQVIRLRADGR